MIKANKLSLNLSNRYILKDLNFSIEKGESVILTGPSASGKSKLLHIIAGLENQFSGEISVSGEIGLVDHKMAGDFFSENILYDLVYGLEIKNVHKQEIRSKIENIIKRFNLKRLIETPFEKISGGEKQLINICSVLISDPEILIMDDPFSMIDTNITNQIIENIIKNKNLTVILSSINTELFKYFDKVIFLNNGHLYFCGKPQELISEHREKLADSGLIL